MSAMRTPVQVDGDGCLLCPNCGFNYTHINRISLLDGAGHTLSVEARGDCSGCTVAITMTAPVIGFVGDRQAFALTVDCEGCDGQSLIVFRQHEGVTMVSRTFSFPPRGDEP